MPNKEVTVTFYQMGKCGFYRYGEPAPEFGGLAETFEQLDQWSAGKHLSLTRLANAGANDEHMPVYLFGMHRHAGGDCVFATWNEVPAEDGAVASVSMDSRIGDVPQIHENAIVENTIPGFPTYFWAVPERDVLATVRIEARVAARAPMASYIERFLATESNYVIEDEDGDIVGYDAIAGDGEAKNVRPRFRVSPYVKAGELAYIRANRGSIKKVHRVAQLDAVNPQDVTMFQNVLRFMRGARANQQAIVDRRVSVALEFTPTERELERMMNEQLNDLTAEKWEDLGFEIDGHGGSIFWVGKASAKATFNLDVPHGPAGVVPLDLVADSIRRQRGRLLQVLG